MPPHLDPRLVFRLGVCWRGRFGPQILPYSPDLEFSPDGQHLAAIIARRQVALLNLATGQTVSRLALSTVEDRARPMPGSGRGAVSSDAINVMEVRARGNTRVPVDLSWTGITVRARIDAPLTDIAFSPDGRLLALGHRDGSASVWNLDPQEAACVLQGHLMAVTEVAFSPTSRRLAISSADGSASVWEVASACKVVALVGTGGALWSVSWSPDGRRLVTGTGQGTLLIWDLASGRDVAALNGHLGPLVCARFLADGNSLVSYANDELFLWKAPPFEDPGP